MDGPLLYMTEGGGGGGGVKQNLSICCEDPAVPIYTELYPMNNTYPLRPDVTFSERRYPVFRWYALFPLAAHKFVKYKIEMVDLIERCHSLIWCSLFCDEFVGAIACQISPISQVTLPTRMLKMWEIVVESPPPPLCNKCSQIYEKSSFTSFITSAKNVVLSSVQFQIIPKFIYNYTKLDCEAMSSSFRYIGLCNVLQ